MTSHQEKSGPRKSGAAEQTIPMLTYGASSNFFVWKERMDIHLTSLFGRIAYFIRSPDRPPTFAVDQINTAGWKPEEIAELSVLRVKQRLAENQEMVAAFNRAFGIILAHMSPQSIERVKLDSDWETTNAKMDAVGLWKIIVKTHQTHRSGVTALDQEEHSSKYASLRQGQQETLTAYNERFQLTVRGFLELGMSSPSQDMQAAHYIESLHEARYGELKLTLRNNASLGVKTYPATLAAAVSAALNFTSARLPLKGAASTRSESAFVTTVDNKSTSKKDNAPPSTKDQASHLAANSVAALDISCLTARDSQSACNMSKALRSQPRRTYTSPLW